MARLQSLRTTMQPRLLSDTASLRVRPGGPVTGNICLQINDCHFPSPGWNDFVVVVMGWWATALLRLEQGQSTHERVPFMDGPYAVELTMVSPAVLRFRALQDENRNTEVASGDGALGVFIADLIVQGRAVLAACQRLNGWSKDAAQLEIALEDLTKLSRSNNFKDGHTGL